MTYAVYERMSLPFVECAYDPTLHTSANNVAQLGYELGWSILAF